MSPYDPQPWLKLQETEVFCVTQGTRMQKRVLRCKNSPKFFEVDPSAPPLPPCNVGALVL